MTIYTGQAANDNRNRNVDKVHQQKLKWFVARAQECMLALITESNPAFEQIEVNETTTGGDDAQVLYEYQVGIANLLEEIELGICEIKLGELNIIVQAMIPVDLTSKEHWVFGITVGSTELQALWDDDGACLIGPANIF